tara:strand:+ start:2156 stop:2470 length:315 start_codon:yes stop_codon:yes gene_type:complete
VKKLYLILGLLLSANALGNTDEPGYRYVDIRCIGEQAENYNLIPMLKGTPLKEFAPGFFELEQEMRDFIAVQCRELYPDTPYVAVWYDDDYRLYVLNYYVYQVE